MDHDLHGDRLREIDACGGLDAPISTGTPRRNSCWYIFFVTKFDDVW